MNQKVHTSKAHALAQKLVKELDIYETKKFTVSISDCERWITITAENKDFIGFFILNQIQDIVGKSSGYHMVCVAINNENILEILIARD